MTFRSKILLAQLPLGAALATIGVLAAVTIRSLGEHSALILRDNYRSVLAAERMKDAAERVDSAVLQSLAGRPLMAGRIAEPIAIFSEELRVQEGNITEPGEAAATRALRAAWTAASRSVDRLRATRELEARRKLYFDSLEAGFKRVRDAADRVLTLNQDAMVRKSDAAERGAAQRTRLIITAAIAICVLGIWASAWLSSRLLRPLRVLGQTVRRFDAGDLAVRARVASRDEIGALAHDFNAMAEHLEQYRKSSLGDLLVAQQASQAAIDAFPDPVVVLGVPAGLLATNRAAGEALRIDAEASAPLEAAPPEIRALLEALRTHVAGGHGAYRPAGFEDAVRVATPDGARDFLASASPVYGETGEVAGAAIVLSDVTRLLRADQLKSDLVSFVAHEFRTPLTSLQMAIHLCAEGAAGPITDKQADLLLAARGDCERLQDIVNDVLDVSRLQQGKLELALEPVEATELVRGALEAQRDLAAGRGQRLHGEAMPDAGRVLVDPRRMKLVFANLIGNALRHARPDGEVLLWARRQEELVRFEVKDDGDGIPLEQQAFVFEKFYRAAGSQPGGGVGLGLYIAREIVRAHGGQIGVQSEAGHGTMLWFTLPASSTAS